jgi:hypothetical protein
MKYISGFQIFPQDAARKFSNLSAGCGAQIFKLKSEGRFPVE